MSIKYICSIGGLDLYMTKSYLNQLESSKMNEYLFGSIILNHKFNNLIIVNVGLSSFAGVRWYGTEHCWRYSIYLDSRKIIQGKCIGGAVYGNEERYLNILEKIPNLKDFIIDNIDEIESNSNEGIVTKYYISRETGEIITL